MQDIEQKAFETYNKNITFLKSIQPALADKIISLENAIENGFYTQKYSLEYKEEGYFDVMELSSENLLYNMNSKEYAKIAAKSVNFNKTDNLYETFNDVKIDDAFAKELESMSIVDNSYSGAAGLINYSNKHADKNKTTMKKLYKFIFLGVGLGLHISEIHEKIRSNVYFIIEDDLELFRLSLFVTDYKDITAEGSELVFCVFEDKDMFRELTKIFLQKYFIYNHYIKFFHMLSHSDKKLKEIQSIIVGQTYLTFNYSALTVSLTRPLQHLKDGYRLLNIGASYKDSAFYKKPVLILGAGPSFGKNIEWLKKNHKKFITIAVSPLLAKLEEVGIKPDIITHVHGFSDAMPHVQKVKDISFFDSTISLFGGFTEPQFRDYFKKENVFIFEGSSRYKRWNTGVTASNIGTMTYGLMLKLSTHDLYLLGIDFAMDQESGKTHSDNHNYVQTMELKEDDSIGGGLVYRTEMIQIKGNLRDKVYTSLLMNGWRIDCNAISKTYKNEDNENIFNLSDGAFIDDAKPMRLEDERISSLQEIDKEALHDELKSYLSEKSESRFIKEEIENLYTRIDYCDRISKIINDHINQKYPDIDSYHYHLIGVFYNILTDEGESGSSDTNYIITLYLQFVSGYIFDLINTKEIKNERKLMRQLDKVVFPQVLRVINYFKNELEEFIKFNNSL